MPNQFIHGKNGMVIISISGGAGVLVSQAKSWRFQIDTDLVDQSNFSSTWKSWLPTPTGWSGTVEGQVDTGSNLLWQIQQSGLQVIGLNFNASILPVACLYPDRNSTSHFYSGKIWPRLSVDVKHRSGEKFTLDFTGEGAFTCV